MNNKNKIKDTKPVINIWIEVLSWPKKFNDGIL